MTSRKKSRTKQRGHLTPTEIALIRRERRRGTAVDTVADALGCSSRTVQNYYSLLKAEGLPFGKPSRHKVAVSAVEPGEQKSSRFYRSDFVPN